MGQKVNPIAFRTGVMEGWKSRWYVMEGWKSRWYAKTGDLFATLLVEDKKIRDFVGKHPTQNYKAAGIDRVEIERTRDEVLARKAKKSNAYKSKSKT